MTCGASTIFSYLKPAPCLQQSSKRCRAIRCWCSVVLSKWCKIHIKSIWSYKVVESLERLYNVGVVHGNLRYRFCLTEIRGDWKFQKDWHCVGAHRLTVDCCTSNISPKAISTLYRSGWTWRTSFSATWYVTNVGPTRTRTWVLLWMLNGIHWMNSLLKVSSQVMCVTWLIIISCDWPSTIICFFLVH